MRIRENAKLSGLPAMLATALGVLLCIAGSAARGGTISWISVATGPWSDTARWSGGANTVVAGDTVNFNTNITSTRVVTIDTTSRTFGILNIGDTDNSAGFTLAASGGATMTLDGNGSNAQINEVSTSKGDIISATTVLNSSLDINNPTSNLLTISAPISSGTSGTKTITNNGTGSVTLSGVITNGAGTVAIVQDSVNSTLTMSIGVSTYSGGVTVLAGTFFASGNGRLGSGPVAIGGTGGSAAATLNASGTYTNAITIVSGSTGTKTIGDVTSANLAFNGPITLNAPLTIDPLSTGNIALGGVITGSSTITVANTGASTALIKLSGLSDTFFTGNVTINGGATLSLEMASSTNFTNVISGAGNLQRTSGTPAAILALGNANTYTGQTRIALSGLQVTSLNKVVAGSASSSLGAPTTAAAGTIAMGSLTSTGTLIYAGAGETTDRVIDLAGTTGGAAIQSDSTAGGLVFSSNLTATGAGNKTLTLQGASAFSNEIQGLIVDNLSGTNNTSLVKNGAGVWIISGTNTYSGTTSIGTAAGIVSGGTLLVKNTIGSGTGSGAVTVNIGTLGGNGTISGPVTLGDSTGTAEAILSPGSGDSATIKTGSLTFNSDGVYAVDVNAGGSGADAVNVTGAVTLNTGSSLAVALTGTLADAQKFFIVVNDDLDPIVGTAGIFAGLPDGTVLTTADLFDLKISYFGDSGTAALTGGNDVVLYAVASAPEPTGAAALIGAAVLVAGRRRRAR